MDDIKESHKLVTYLQENGHEKIAVLAGYIWDQSISRLRIQGYYKAFEDKGMSVDEELIRYTPKNRRSYTMENGYELTKELIKSNKDVTAVYAVCDTMALGACKAILDSGKRIPEDYSVVGFDGLEITHYYNPSITTIRQPVEEMARETTNILFDLINKKVSNKHKVFEGELIVGQSSKKICD